MFSDRTRVALARRYNVSREGEFALDDARPEKIQQLINLGRGEAVKQEHLDIVKARFLNGIVAEAFIPFHAVTT